MPPNVPDVKVMENGALCPIAPSSVNAYTQYTDYMIATRLIMRGSTRAI
jgi:hypothetical protein